MGAADSTKPGRRYAIALLVAVVLLLVWDLELHPLGKSLDPRHVVFAQPGQDRRFVLLDLAGLAASLLGFAIAGHALIQSLRDPARRRRFIFAHVLLVVLAALGLGALELAAAFYAPSWPARDLRPIAWSAPAWRAGAEKELALQFNSWGMRDKERTLAKPPGKKRLVFIGDSFLEGAFCRTTLPALCENSLADTECVNLGVSMTDPRHYFQRLESVGKRLSPDGVLVFFFEGNDWLSENEGFAPVDASPSAVLKRVAPRFSWLLGTRAFRKGGTISSTSDEPERIRQLLARPFDEAVRGLSELTHASYLPDVPVEKIASVLGRGGPGFFAAFGPREVDEETLPGWLLAALVRTELEDARARAPRSVGATVSWLVAMRDACREREVPFVVFLVPEGSTVDPELVDFWKPWPGLSRELEGLLEQRRELARELRKAKIDTVDLGVPLARVRGAYRKSDRHWTEKGHELAATAVTQAIIVRFPR